MSHIFAFSRALRYAIHAVLPISNEVHMSAKQLTLRCAHSHNISWYTCAVTLRDAAEQSHAVTINSTWLHWNYGMRITTRVFYLSIYAWGQQHIQSIKFLARGAGVALQPLQTLEWDAVEDMDAWPVVDTMVCG